MANPQYLSDDDPVLQQLPSKQFTQTPQALTPTAAPQRGSNPMYLSDSDPLLSQLKAPVAPLADPKNPLEAAQREIEGDGTGTGPISMALQFLGQTKRIASGEEVPPGYPVTQSDTDMPGEKVQPVQPAMVGATMGMTSSAAGNPLAGAELLGAVKSGGSKAAQLATETKQLFSQPENSIVNNLKPQAGTFFKAARESGGEIPPEHVNAWLDTLGEQGSKKTIVKNQPISDYIQSAEEKLRNQPMKMNDLIDYDQELGDLITSNYISNPAASRTFHVIQDSLRNSADASGESGVPEWQQALKTWTQGRKLDDISRIADRAEASPNPSTAIQSSIRTMKGNKARTRGWTDEELSALDDAGKTGVLTHVAQIAGNHLGPLASAAVGELTGGPGIGATAFLAHAAATKGAKNFAGNMQMKKLNALADLIKNNGQGEE